MAHRILSTNYTEVMDWLFFPYDESDWNGDTKQIMRIEANIDSIIKLIAKSPKMIALSDLRNDKLDLSFRIQRLIEVMLKLYADKPQKMSWYYNTYEDGRTRYDGLIQGATKLASAMNRLGEVLNYMENNKSKLNNFESLIFLATYCEVYKSNAHNRKKTRAIESSDKASIAERKAREKAIHRKQVEIEKLNQTISYYRGQIEVTQAKITTLQYEIEDIESDSGRE